jgi:small-conductance mechanosensitive channel
VSSRHFSVIFQACLCSIFLFVALSSFSPQAIAQTAPPPAGLSKEQFDALVEAIGESVVLKLRALPAYKSGSAQPAASDPAEADNLEDRVGEFVARGIAAIAAFPELGRRLSGLPTLIVEAGGGRGFLSFVAILLISILAALGAERLVGRSFGNIQLRLSMRAAASPGLPAALPLLGILAIDLLGLAAVWLVSYGAIGIWFSRGGGQDKLAAAILAGIFAWRLYMLAFRVLLRPALPGARLASMDDAGASAVYRRISLVILLIVALRIVIRLLIATNAPPEVVAAGQLVVSTATVSLAIWAAMTSRIPMARWFADLAHDQGERSFRRRIGVHWLYLAVPLFLILGLTQIYGAIAARYTVPNAMLLTMNAVIALILLQTLSRYFTRQRASVRTSTDAEMPSPLAPRPPRFLDVVVRCVRTAILIAVIVTVAQSWIVDVFALVDTQGWRALTRSSFATGVTLFLAFVAWELVNFFTRRGGAVPANATSGGPSHGEAAAGGSRLATLVPLLRVVLAITISVLALLIVLSELGVNIGPLLAGASVFGLAISFGSQALVRDIVSGVFYLSDDAFRIGEYIDCGKAKGSVEGFTLRSIRLRHQNGQVHTIPFGQLGQITNFSRDWATVKFNLRFKRDTDLEKLRKTVKKIGDELQQDPELKDEFLAPLRMQGVADILDNALLVRFKFTVRPNEPSLVQRVAVKNMVAKFAEVGIEFADSMVAVQTLSSGSDPAAAAAASTAQTRSRSEAALPAESGA